VSQRLVRVFSILVALQVVLGRIAGREPALRESARGSPKRRGRPKPPVVFLSRWTPIPLGDTTEPAQGPIVRDQSSCAEGSFSAVNS
jgi:hypothetical protein